MRIKYVLYNLHRHTQCIVKLHSIRCIYFCANKAIYVLHVLVIHECLYITCLMCNSVSIRMYRINFNMLCSYIFLSSWIMDCMLFTFKNKVPLMRLGASVVWHLSLPMMNSFNKTEAAIFPCRICFLRAFISLIIPVMNHFQFIKKLYMSYCLSAVKC